MKKSTEFQTYKPDGGYVVDRPFFVSTKERTAVLEQLPTFEGKTAVDWINLLIKERKKIKILDIGGGDGTAAADIQREYGKKVQVVNLVNERFKKNKLKKPGRTVLADATKRQTSQSLISQFDFIYSTNTALHLETHWMNYLPYWYELLNTGGIALLDVRSNFSGIQQLYSTQEWLSDHGYSIEFTLEGNLYVPTQMSHDVSRISLRKTHHKLLLPLSHSKKNRKVVDKRTVGFSPIFTFEQELGKSEVPQPSKKRNSAQKGKIGTLLKLLFNKK